MGESGWAELSSSSRLGVVIKTLIGFWYVVNSSFWLIFDRKLLRTFSTIHDIVFL
jgi:hypothetical protein